MLRIGCGSGHNRRFDASVRARDVVGQQDLFTQGSLNKTATVRPVVSSRTRVWTGVSSRLVVVVGTMGEDVRLCRCSWLQHMSAQTDATAARNDIVRLHAPVVYNIGEAAEEEDHGKNGSNSRVDGTDRCVNTTVGAGNTRKVSADKSDDTILYQRTWKTTRIDDMRQYMWYTSPGMGTILFL